jgi:formylglycine-generating enzyme required for sulfatase activity
MNMKIPTLLLLAFTLALSVSCADKKESAPSDTSSNTSTGLFSNAPTGTATITDNSVQTISGDNASFTNSIGMKFVMIPAGEFQMGANLYEHEKPVHNVKITKPFYMQAAEVTQKQWAAVMGNNPSNFRGDDLPVEQVSWNDAQEFIKKLNEKERKKAYRLPTEAEWEYACRAGSKGKFCFGDNEGTLGEYAWYNANFECKTYPVGQKKPNAWGLFDMHGNVWEWCQDLYGSDYYSNSPFEDPQGPKIGGCRVLRGGCWDTQYADHCRSATRLMNEPDYRAGNYGFRLSFSSTAP